DYGREKYYRLNESNIVRQEIDARIVECFAAYQQARISRRWKPRENFRQVPRTHFRRSTGAPRERSKAKQLLARLGRAHLASVVDVAISLLSARSDRFQPKRLGEARSPGL